MDPSTQAAPGYYVWESPGNPVAVHLRLDVIDRLSVEIMRGFGLVPKRGAEVGGVLLGVIEQGEKPVVRVEDFDVVACDYKRGPSYLFTADDGAAFEDTCVRRQPGSSQSVYAVGYFRSHTREGLSLAPEDIELMEQYFPSPAQIALLVKPYATKVSVASFFIRHNGLFPSAAPLEFPFRRRELTGEEGPPRRTVLERLPRQRPARREARDLAPQADFGGEDAADPAPAAPGPAYAYTSPFPTRTRSGWVWLPMSSVFLLLGLALGFLVAFVALPRGAGGELSLGLSVVKAGGNLNVTWNRDAPAIRAASTGTLEIEEAGKVTPVTLDQVTLQSGGNIVYTNSSGTVEFRLKVSPRPNVTVTEAAEWKTPPQ